LSGSSSIGKYAKVFKRQKKGLHSAQCTVVHWKSHMFINVHIFANNPGTGCDIIIILTDSDSAGQRLYSGEKYEKINAKSRTHLI
jgi:hypothetical protein